MSERDKKAWAALKADPVKYAEHLERKRAERARRVGYEARRKKAWREANPEAEKRLRAAHRAVEKAVRNCKLIRPNHCESCGKWPCKPEAHHYMGYAPENWLRVLWLCETCHAKAEHSRSDEA